LQWRHKQIKANRCKACGQSIPLGSFCDACGASLSKPSSSLVAYAGSTIGSLLFFFAGGFAYFEYLDWRLNTNAFLRTIWTNVTDVTCGGTCANATIGTALSAVVHNYLYGWPIYASDIGSLWPYHGAFLATLMLGTVTLFLILKKRLLARP